MKSLPARLDDTVGNMPTRHDFSTLLDGVFRVDLDDVPAGDLVLVKIEQLVSNEVQENFSLLFKGPIDGLSSQGIYRLANERLGEIDLFLVPVKKDESGMYYEAVFNNFLIG